MSNKKNLANGELSAAITAIATSATLKSGQGSRMPSVPFFATVAPLGEMSTVDNSEVIDVTAISGDVLTIVRAQKSTTAKAFTIDSIVANGVYVEDLLLGATDLTATGISGTKFLRGDNTWQIPIDTNTTYAEIPSAEITTGTASTARAITGRRSQEIVTKAQTGVIKSATTNKLTVATSAPASPTAGDVWIDDTSLPENLAPSSIVWKETPTGLVNSSNTVYTTSQGYVSGTLQVFINGVAQSSLVAETAPGSGTFTVTPAPLTGDTISVQYQVRVTATGNADALSGNSLTAILQAIYPVGATFISGSDTMPSLVSGIGTWARLKGRVIVGLDEAQTEFDVIDEVGGHKLMQVHNHSITTYRGGPTPNNGRVSGSYTGGGGTVEGEAISQNYGSGDSQNLQPYKVKYMFERTA